MESEISVLIVEDDRSIAHHLTEWLECEGYRVAVCRDGESLRTTFASPPALVLLAVFLPGLDGLELFRRLRANQRTRCVPVVFMSVLPAESLAGVLRATLPGYHYEDILQKPFGRDELLTVVRCLAVADARLGVRQPMMWHPAAAIADPAGDGTIPPRALSTLLPTMAPAPTDASMLVNADRAQRHAAEAACRSRPAR